MQSILADRIFRKRAEITRKRAEYDVLADELTSLDASMEEAQESLDVAIEAQKYIQTAAELTQKAFERQLADIVTPALEAVVDDTEPYKFRVSFEQRRGKTECDLLFERDGEVVDPVADSGLGMADIASLALKTAYRELSGTRRILVFDEPGKNLSSGYRAAFAALVRRISGDLGVQMVIISHNDEMIEMADNLVTITQERGVSRCS